MSPIIPPRFRSALTTRLLPSFTIHRLEDVKPRSGNLILKDIAAAPTPAALVERKADPQNFVTLTVSQPSEAVYVTTILLGDSYPAPTERAQQQTSNSQTLTPARATNQGTSAGTIAGIIIGVLGGLAVLTAVFYVWILRARQWEREMETKKGKPRKRRKKKKKHKKKKSTWYTFRFKFKKSKKKGRSRRSSTSTRGE